MVLFFQVATVCQKCSVKFGFYTCLICHLFDDADKQQYHCEDCGICRLVTFIRFILFNEFIKVGAACISNAVLAWSSG
jgi:hypothetical protein